MGKTSDGKAQPENAVVLEHSTAGKQSGVRCGDSTHFLTGELRTDGQNQSAL